MYDFSWKPSPSTSSLVGSFLSLWMKSNITPCVPRGPTMLANRCMYPYTPKVPTHAVMRASLASFEAP